MIAAVARLRQAARRRPARAALLIVGAYVVVLGIYLATRPVADAGPVFITPERISQIALPQFLLAASAVLFLAVLGWWREVWLTTPLAPKSARVLILPLLLLLGLVVIGESISSLTGVRPRLAEIVTYASALVWVGVFEELLFRGILLYGLSRWLGPIRAALVSSLIFGLLHYGNFFAGQGAMISHFQVIHATSLGLMLAAITLRTNSLWPAILFHACWDLAAVANLARGAAPEAVGTPEAAALAPGLILSGVELAIAVGILTLWARGQTRHAD